MNRLRHKARMATRATALAFLALLPSAWAAPLKHGADVSPGTVGPAAAGITQGIAADTGQIKDGAHYAFAKEIAATAVYDGITVTGPHLLIEGVRFDTPIDISRSSPVVLRGVSVRVPGKSPWTILVRPQAGPVFVLWSDAGGDGADTSGKAPASALNLRGGRATIFRSRFSHTADGIDISGTNVAITESLVDDLVTFAGSHNDGIQLEDTAADVKIERSKILNRNAQTSCLYLLGRRINVIETYLAGGGWTVYGGAKNNGHGGGSAAHVWIEDTIFGGDYAPKSGHFGPVSYWTGAATHVWRDNRFSDGTPIAP